jgi:predicted dehydrogenase
MRYLVNAGSLDAGSWYTDRSEGSRFVGEGGHFIDTLTWWAGHDPVAVSATAAGSGVVATLEYPDGSTGVVSYLTDGPSRLPKETFDAVAPGHAVRLDNFVGFTEWTGRRGRSRKRALAADKGQRAQLDAVLRALTDGTPMPVTLESLARTTMATLLVERALIDGGRHSVEAALAGLGSTTETMQERAG